MCKRITYKDLLTLILAFILLDCAPPNDKNGTSGNHIYFCEQKIQDKTCQQDGASVVTGKEIYIYLTLAEENQKKTLTGNLYYFNQGEVTYMGSRPIILS